MRHAKTLGRRDQPLGGCYLLLVVLLPLFPGTAIATLGQPAQSIGADQRVLGGQLQTVDQRHWEAKQSRQPASNETYTVHQISTASGVVVNEYVSTNGTVFAVSWQGPRPPNLSQLLGPYFSDYQAAAAAPHPQRHLMLRTEALVVETGGHMRDVRGRAFIPSMLPPNFSTEEIR